MSSPIASDKLLFEYDGSLGYTVLQNIFIEGFLPAASGNDVKVYLVGLKRCFGRKDSQWASNHTIAKECGLSLRSIQRAWRYWQEVGLIKVIPRFVRSLDNPSDYRTELSGPYRTQTSNIVRFANLEELGQQLAIRKALVDARDEVAAALAHPHDRTDTHPHDGVVAQTHDGVVTLRNPSSKNYNLKELQGLDDQPPVAAPVTAVDTVVSGPTLLPEAEFQECLELSILCDTYTRVTSKEPSQAEKAHLWRIFASYGLADADDALKEAATKRRGKNLLRYVEGILGNWTREGKRLSMVGTATTPQREGSIPSSHSSRGTRLRSGEPRAENPSYYGQWAQLEEKLLDAGPPETEVGMVESVSR